MAASKKKPSDWQRSPSIGITPITVRSARYGKQTVTKTDLILNSSVGPSVAGPVTAGTAGGTGAGAAAAAVAAGVEIAGAVNRVCSVCISCSAEYSCPRCLIAYCSSKCYKVCGIHGPLRMKSCYILALETVAWRVVCCGAFVVCIMQNALLCRVFFCLHHV